MPARPTPIKRDENINIVIVRNPVQEQRVGFIPRWDPYIIKIDLEKNCYNYRRFEHLARYCRNQRIMGKGRRIELEDNKYLKEEGDQNLDWILSTTDLVY